MRQKNKEGIRRQLLGARIKSKVLGMATLLTFILPISTLSAQENVNTTGAYASGSGGSISYSVGQVTYKTYTGSNGSVAEGIQQPYEFWIITAIEEANDINLTFSVFPNPTSNYLLLIINESNISDLSYQLYEMQGKLLQSKKIKGNQTSIDMSNLAPAIYFVKINQDKKEIKTFKIIKN